MAKIQKLNIQGQLYKVTNNRNMRPNGILGLCEKDKKSIHIDKSETGENYMLTLMHESIHALFHEIGIDQTMAYEVEEMLCEIIPKHFIRNFKVTFKK